jgi:FixJ family two-component response regulator
MQLGANFKLVISPQGGRAGKFFSVSAFFEGKLDARGVDVFLPSDCIAVAGGGHMTASPPLIHVVDDDASFRTAVGELLSACGYRVSLYETAKQLLAAPLNNGPACILLDVQMAGMSGPQLQARLAGLGCQLPIVFLSAYGDVPTTVTTIKAGAEDFLTKPATRERLLEAIQRALTRYENMLARGKQISALQSLYAKLTRREQEVFALLVRGKPHKQIAYELGISDRTVKLHRHQLVQKLRVRSLAEAAVIAERLGLLPQDGTVADAGAAHAKHGAADTLRQH